MKLKKSAPICSTYVNVFPEDQLTFQRDSMGNY